uniref:Uncharacterized protein n=1 Tax=Anguilla anguilla TaxID=7936 RepID=A0A0E9THT3_ANGAN
MLGECYLLASLLEEFFLKILLLRGFVWVYYHINFNRPICSSCMLAGECKYTNLKYARTSCQAAGSVH